jgi:hypothetical protein
VEVDVSVDHVVLLVVLHQWSHPEPADVLIRNRGEIREGNS